MTQILQRVTSVFVPSEDRIRMAGETEDGRAAVVWLTRRMMGVLLPVLFKQLDDQFASSTPEHRQLMQEVAQHAASDSLEASEPVLVAGDIDVLLATTVEVTRAELGVILTFHNESDTSFSLPLASEVLRQWLQILYRADVQADWRLPQWPAWLTGESDTAPAATLAMH